MSGRTEALAARLATLGQLGAVTGAMRGIAAARADEARSHAPGMRAWSEAIVATLGDALGLLEEIAGDALRDPDGSPAPDLVPRGPLLLALCSDQGFVGGFDDAVLDALESELEHRPDGRVALVGRRGAESARARGLDVEALDAAVRRVGAIPAAARELEGRVRRAVTREGRASVLLIHARATAGGRTVVARRQVVPFDVSRVGPRTHAVPPLATAAPGELVRRLIDEYLFAVLCDALLQAHVAENLERARAMVRAHANVERLLEVGRAEYRRARQESITAEVAELAAGRRAR